MKIMVGCSAPPDRGSGILAYARDLSESLLKLGVEVHFVSPPPCDDQWLKQHGIHHVPTDQFDNPLERAAQLSRYVEDFGIEGIINNDNALLQSIAPSVRCPFIAVGHMSKRSIAALACYQSHWSDYVVAISGDMQREFVMKYGVPVSRCPVVYTGVADPGEMQARLADQRPELRLIFAGGFNTAIKGADLVFDAVRCGEQDWRGVHLEWFGEIPRHRRRQLEKYNFVTLHGHVSRERFLEVMKTADILLLPSRYEGCPMTMLEAMAHGVVPVASDGVGAMSEIVTSGKDGFICHVERWPQQMLECVSFLEQRRDLLQKIRQEARRRYLAEFRSTLVAERLLELMHQPAIERHTPLSEFDVLRWHRPLRKDGRKSPILDRICNRLGLLRKAGRIEG